MEILNWLTFSLRLMTVTFAVLPLSVVLVKNVGKRFVTKNYSSLRFLSASGKIFKKLANKRHFS